MKKTSIKTLKRKSQEAFPLNELNQDLLEKVLSRIPPSRFFSLRPVCKSWNSIADSSSFHLACSEVQSRKPWFLMVGQELNQSIIFDTSSNTWKKLNHPTPLQQIQSSTLTPIASSNGLVCFHGTNGRFLVSNLLTNTCREIPPLQSNNTIHAIAMSSSMYPSYKIVVLLGEYPNLSVVTFNSKRNEWENENQLTLRKSYSIAHDQEEPETLYFLSKAGEVVSTNMQRSSTKQYSSILTIENGEEIVYFLGHLGNVVACTLNTKSFYEFPRILPIHYEYSIDLVECNGHMYVVILYDFLESASLNVWKFLEEEKAWQQVASMPPCMSHEFYGKKVDINCVGYGDLIMVCMNSYEVNRYMMCDVKTNEWVELPKCFLNGKEEEFVSALSFEPRIEVNL